MTADPTVYDSQRMAFAYAYSRPPIHAVLAKRIAATLPTGFECPAALDIGCGAGLSTAALTPIAARRVGIDLFAAMLEHAHSVAPGAEFVVASAEHLPFDCSAFDVITAAGSLNYTDVGRSLREISRVLRVGGFFVPYDFSAGRIVAEDRRLSEILAVFRSRFPPPQGYALDLQTLPYADCNMSLMRYDEFDVALPMHAAGYVQYLLAEPGIELAIRQGMPQAEAQALCAEQFEPLFAQGPRTVRFRVMLAMATKLDQRG